MIFGQTSNIPTITPDELTDVIQNRSTPWSEYWPTMVREGFYGSIPGVVARDYQVPNDDRELAPGSLPGGGGARGKIEFVPENPVMSDEEWKSSPYYREGIPNDGRMTEARAKAKAEIYDENQYRGWLRENRPWGVGTVAMAVTGSLAGAAADPLNYIPSFGPAFRVANASRASVILARAGIGAAENMVIAALEEPLIVQSKRQFGDDVSFADSLMNIAISGLFGGVVGGVAGRFQRMPDTIAARHPARVASALQTLGEAADSLANDRPIDIAGPYRASLLAGSSLSSRTDAAIRTVGDAATIRTSGLNPPAFEGSIEIPVTRPDGSPAIYAADLTGFKSEIRRLTTAAAEEGRTLEIRDAPDGRKMLVETSAVRWLDQFPDEASAKTSLNRLPPAERKGIDIVPFESADRGRGFALVKGATPAQVAEIRTNPQLADSIRGGTDIAPTTPVAAPRETFDQAFAATAPSRPRSLDTVIRDTPLTPPGVMAKADAAVGKPQTFDDVGSREIAADHGLNEAGDFMEMEDIRRLTDSDLLTKQEIADLADADALVKRSDTYAKAYQAAAFCLGRL